MTPISTDSTNLLLKKPSDWEETIHGKCTPLPVSHYEGVFYSYWEPSFFERLKIFLGGHIRVCIASEFHPPIALDTEK